MKADSRPQTHSQTSEMSHSEGRAREGLEMWRRLDQVRLDPQRPAEDRLEAMRLQDVIEGLLNRPPRDSNS